MAAATVQGGAIAPRPMAAELRDGAVFLLLPEPRGVVDARGRPMRLQPGWSVLHAMEFTSDVTTLALRHADGGVAVWLLGADGRFLGDIAQLRRKDPAGLAARLAPLLPAITAGIWQEMGRTGGLRPEAGRHAHDAALHAAGVLADHAAACVTMDLVTFVAGIRGIGEGERAIRRHAAAVRRALLRPPDVLTMLADPAIRLPSLRPGGGTVAVRHLPFYDDAGHSAALIWDRDDLFYVVFVLRDGPAIRWALYAPAARVLVREAGQGLADAEFNAMLGSLLGYLLAVAAPGERLELRKTARLGTVLQGTRNFGHGIWDELQAVDGAAAHRHLWDLPPIFYLPERRSAAALFGALDEIYPDFAGTLLPVGSFRDALDHALRHGVQILPLAGRMARKATRDRLTRMAFRHGEATGIAAAAAALRQGGRPFIVLGLRLTNRRPVDFLGFHERLIAALCDRFGDPVIILDGINRDPANAHAAAAVFNGGVPRASTDALLAEELDYAALLERRVAHLPASIVNAVGTGIRDNLAWLAQADFFVAPNGGGLAKLRWALDIPGYVLNSRTNFEYCSLFDLYADPRYMEPPFSPLYMNAPDEVEDVPGAADSGPPQILKIPHPENFHLREATVIPRICDLLAKSLDEARGARPAEIALDFPQGHKTPNPAPGTQAPRSFRPSRDEDAH